MFFRRRSHAVDGAYGSGENMWDGTRILVHSGSMGRTFVGGRTLEGGRLQPRTWLPGCSTLHGGFCRFYAYGMYSLGFTSRALNGPPHHGLQEEGPKNVGSMSGVPMFPLANGSWRQHPIQFCQIILPRSKAARFPCHSFPTGF